MMKSCTCASLESPIEASRPSLQNFNKSSEVTVAPRRLVRKPSKLQTTMDITRCRIGSTSRPAAPIGYEDLVPQKDWTPIFHAVYHDRGGALHHFLHTGVSPDDTEGSGIPLLCVAAACGHFEIANILLEAGACIDAASKDKGETALHVAVKAGRHDMIDLLIEHRANLGAKTIHTGETALHYAASGSGSLALVVKLLKSGADYNIQNLECHTPAAAALQANNLHAAVAIINMAGGNTEQLARDKDLLLQYIKNMKDRCPMTNDLIADMFAATCDPDSTVLVEAIKKNDARLVEIFLDKGADPHRTTAEDLFPIFAAVKFADLRIIKLLVQHGADVTVRDRANLEPLQFLFKACSTRDEDSIISIVDYLLAKGADGLALYSDGKTLLHRTVSGSFDRAKVVNFLLKHGIKVNIQDNDGNTALHLAAHNGLGNAAKFLLHAHADTTIVDSTKRTPLLRAVLEQQWPLVQMMTLPPAMTSWDAEGSTALHHIARSIPRDGGTWEEIAAAARLFCERGVCRSLRDRSGATPLIQAIKTLPDEGLPVIQALLAGGDQKWNCVGHEDHKRRDALYYAAILGKTTFVEVLLEHDAPFVLEDWVDSKRQHRLPAASKHRTLELLIESNQSREATRAQKPHSSIRETRVEIIRAEPRSHSALPGYGANCETERKSEANRNISRKAPLTGQFQVPAQPQEPLASPITFPARTTSKQQRSRRLTEDYHRTVHCSPAVPDRTADTSAAAIQYSQRHCQRVSITRRSPPRQMSEVNANFLPGPPSKQQFVVLSGPATSELDTATHVHETAPSQKELEASPIVAAKNTIVAGKVDASTKVPQVPPNPYITPVQSMPPVAQVTPATDPKPVTAPWPSTKTSATLENHAAQITAGPVKQDSLRTPLAAASNILADGKPVQPARVDSCAGMIVNTALPALHRSKPTLPDSTPTPRRQSGDEFTDWLAINNMLDRL